MAKKHSAVEPQPRTRKLARPAGALYMDAPTAGNTTSRTTARDERTNTVAKDNALAFAPAGENFTAVFRCFGHTSHEALTMLVAGAGGVLMFSRNVPR